MKNLQKIVLSIILLGLTCALISNNTDINYFILDGEKYELTNAHTIVNGSGDDTKGYGFTLFITSSSLDLSNLFKTGFSGKGNMLNFRLRSSSSEGITAATYSKNGGYKDYRPNTYGSIAAFLDYENKGKYGAQYNVENGNVVIKVTGNIYTINFDLTLEDGKSLKGNYTGKIVHLTP